MKRIWIRVKPWMIPAGLTLLLYLLLKFVFLIGYVPTPSMEPTLPEESFIFGTRIFRELKTGDIIVFEKDGVLLVKRIAGCPSEIFRPHPIWHEDHGQRDDSYRE